MVLFYHATLIMVTLMFYSPTATFELQRKCLWHGTPGWKCDSGRCIPTYWVCDKEYQCESDNSDEEEGCKLYPETNCESWEGQKYVRCPDSLECIRFTNESQIEKECLKHRNNQVNDANASFSNEQWSGEDSKWKCTDGFPIDINLVCNGASDCDDSSDEMRGCELYGTDCRSWGGLRHEKCQVPESLSFSSSVVCTLPQFNLMNDSSACRNCTDMHKWRCDDGYCIDQRKHRDGIPDCADGSDEKPVPLRMWRGVLITMAVTGVGICVSFFYRCFIGRKVVCKKCLNIRCESKINVANHVRENLGLQLHYMTLNGEATHKTTDSSQEHSTNGGETILDISADIHVTKKIPKGVTEHFAQTTLPLELIELLENSKDSKNFKRDCPRQILAQHLYAKVHQASCWYRNLYYYFFLRCDTSQALNKYTSQFYSWELEFHDGKPLEALKCWRLHIGSSDILKALLSSLRGPGILDKLSARCIPVRNVLRNLRFTQDAKNNDGFSDQNEIWVLRNIYKVLKCAWYSIKPFMGASALYFDIFKDVSISVIMLSTLASVTNDKIFKEYRRIEAGMLLSLLCAIFLVQVCWMWISFFYATDIFEICKDSSWIIKCLVKTVSILFAPLMPAFVLANYVYYQERTQSLRRNLQTLGKKRCGFNKAMSRFMQVGSVQNISTPNDIAILENETSNDDDVYTNADIHTKKQKLKLFEQIVQNRYKAKYFRRMYSFFRVVHATIESYCVIAVLVLMLIVSENPDDHSSGEFMEVLTAKLSVFIEFSGKRENLRETKILGIEKLGLVKNVAIWGSIVYSCVMLVTALTRYVYQSKSRNLSRIGQMIIGLYFLCHVVTRLTTTIVIFATGHQRASQSAELGISYLSAVIITPILSILHFVVTYWYKYRYIREFREKNDIVERCIHVIANTVVVIPYTNWDTKSPSEGKMKHSPLNHKTRHRTGSLDDLLRSKIFKKWGHRKTLSTGNIPDMEQIMKEIEAIWWENPTRKLVLNAELKEKMLHRIKLQKTDENIEKAFRYLEDEGFINKQLYNPRRTKQEYFWLMLIHVLLNVIAICIEIINGAVDTDKGKYVTWDIRMLSFVLGLVFLCSYYKKFHILKDLTRTHLCGLDGKYCKIFCCYKDDRPMSAIPDYEVMQKCLQRPESNYKRYKNVETQTSELCSKLKGEESESIHINENLTDERKIEKLVQCN